MTGTLTYRPSAFKGLGLVASGKRRIKSGFEWDGLYDKKGLLGTNPIMTDGDTYETLKQMEQIVRKTLNDTVKVAAKLKGSTMATTLRNNWQHVYDHFQYERDADGVEQLRRPSRSWNDRKKGIDCDCMSIELSSLLTNQGIPHAFRMTEYNSDTGWQHVYVVVPKTMGATMDKRENYTVLDCVVDKYDYEVPFKKKYDHFMKIQYLNGLDPSAFNGGITQSLASKAKFEQVLSGYGNEFEMLGALNGIGLSGIEAGNMFIRALKQHLINTRFLVTYNPTLLTGGYPAVLFQQRLDYLLQNFDDPTKRNEAFNVIENLETKDSAALNGLDGLGSKFFSKIKKGIKSVAKTAVKMANPITATKKIIHAAGKVTKVAGHAIAKGAKAVGKAAKVAGKAVVKAAKVVGKAIIRFNPLSIAIRNGVLLAMQINLFRFAEKLGYGYWTEEQIKSKGLDVGQWKNAQKALHTIRNIYKGLQGNLGKLDNAIKKGWASGAKKHRLPTLGDPTIAASTTVLATIAGILGKLDFKKFFGGKAESPHESVTDDVIQSAVLPATAELIKDNEGDVAAATMDQAASNNGSNDGEATDAESFNLSPTPSPEEHNYSGEGNRAPIASRKSQSIKSGKQAGKSATVNTKSNSDASNTGSDNSDNGSSDQSNQDSGGSDSPTNASAIQKTGADQVEDLVPTGKSATPKKSNTILYVAGGAILLTGIIAIALSSSNKKKKSLNGVETETSTLAEAPEVKTEGLEGVKRKIKETKKSQTLTI